MSSASQIVRQVPCDHRVRLGSLIPPYILMGLLMVSSAVGATATGHGLESGNGIQDDYLLPTDSQGAYDLGHVSKHSGLLGSSFSALNVGNSTPSDAQCEDVKKQNGSERCAFVRNTEDCGNDEGFINYTESLYCTFGTKLLPLGMAVLVLWWLTLFVALAVAADKFFCPSLVVIARTLRMSDNIAGVTLLAFGNGAPDVFSAIAAVGNMKKGDAGLAVGALVGAGVFVTTVVAGSVALVKPFHAMERPFLRDIIFYLATVFMAFYVLYHHVITLLQAVAFILVYIIYVVVVIVGRYIYQARKRRLRAEALMSGEEIEDENEGEPSLIHAGISSEPTGENATVTAAAVPANAPQPEPNERPDELTPLLASSINHSEHVSALKEFLLAISPVDVEEWPKEKWYWKIYNVFKIPSEFLLLVTVPIVDFEARKQSWNRHLNAIHCITAPVTAIICASHNTAFTKLGGVFPVWALVLMIGFVFAVIVYCTSTNGVPPFYHRAFAFIGFFAAVCWIDAIANEIVNLLQTFGIVFSISNAILGLTLLAWGNSLGDLVADTTMARQGQPRIGISACFGGPMFNLLLGLGIPFTIKTLQDGDVELDFTVIQVLLLAALGGSLVSALIILPLIRFNLNRPYGIFLYCFYGVFLILAILIETKVITGTLPGL